MIILLSPAKTLDTQPSPIEQSTRTRLSKKSQALVEVLKEKTVSDLQQLMNVSEKIAQTNVARFQDLAKKAKGTTKQAALLFKGDVYQGLQADTFGEAEWTFAQKHLRILSGLYGVLRPLDLIRPYRLEMGTKLKNGSYKNLYDFWAEDITNIINEDLKQSGSDVVLNLASKEYFKSIQPKALKGQVIEVVFKEKRGDTYKIIAFNAKKARGALAHQIIKYNITDVNQIKDLEVNGYLYHKDWSNEHALFFVKN